MSEAILDAEAVDVTEISQDEGRQMLDAAARKHLNMSAEEFISAWDRGLFAGQDSREVHEVAMLLPFGR